MNKFSISIKKNLNSNEVGGSPSVGLNDILKKSFFTRLLIKLDKPLRKVNSFFSTSNRRTRTPSYLSIDGCNGTPVEDIYGDMLQVTLVIHLSVITKIINFLLENWCFPDNLKLAKVSLIFKKNDDLEK